MSEAKQKMTAEIFVDYRKAADNLLQLIIHKTNEYIAGKDASASLNIYYLDIVRLFAAASEVAAIPDKAKDIKEPLIHERLSTLLEVRESLREKLCKNPEVLLSPSMLPVAETFLTCHRALKSQHYAELFDPAPSA